MHDDDDRLQAMFRADLQRLRASAPTPTPAWRVVQRAQARAAERMARQVRWAWRIAALVFAAVAIVLAWRDPRTLIGLLAPLALGGLACWHDEPAPLQKATPQKAPPQKA